MRRDCEFEKARWAIPYLPHARHFRFGQFRNHRQYLALLKACKAPVANAGQRVAIVLKHLVRHFIGLGCLYAEFVEGARGG